MEKMFHIYSDGALAANLFESDSDMDAAMNRIAVVAFITNVAVLGFSIQDTHVHILLKACWENVVKFKCEYQKRTRDYISRTTIDNVTNNFILEIIPVTDDSYAKRVAAYVIYQATKDGKKVMQYDYRWSSAALYFRKTCKDLLWTMSADGHHKRIDKMGSVSLRNQYRIFHVGFRLPDEWDVCEGIILPSSYVDIAGFEELYVTHNAFRVFCGGSSARDFEIMEVLANNTGISYEESEARQLAQNLCHQKFGIKDIRKLNANQRLELAAELRRKHRISINQIARRVYLPETEVRKYLK